MHFLILLGGAQHDTVAAVTHILFTITNPSTSLTSIESQLWLTDSKFVNSDSNMDLNGKSLGGRLSSSVANIRCGNSSTDFLRSTGRNVLAGQGQGQGQNILSNAANKVVKSNADINAVMDAHPYSSSSSLAGTLLSSTLSAVCTCERMHASLLCHHPFNVSFISPAHSH